MENGKEPLAESIMMFLRKVEQTEDGGYILCGYSSSKGAERNKKTLKEKEAFG